VSDAGAHADGAHAQLTARFALHAEDGQDAAAAAAELIHRLQEVASLPDCACDLDVEVQWPDAAANGGGLASARNR
jgi:hypothetical protein